MSQTEHAVAVLDARTDRHAVPLIVVSSDTHVGPWLEQDLRPYCPTKYLEEFDAYALRHREHLRLLLDSYPRHMFTEVEPGKWTRGGHNLKTDGHRDVHARLRDMNYDGIAAEVIFHGSTNDEPIPFSALGDPRAFGFFRNQPPDDPELVGLGRHMYNQWLADFCSVEPERHVGLAQLPIWDIDAAVREIEWAKSVGLRGVNFPANQSWLPPYNDDFWEPLWSAAEAHMMPLVTHIGGAAEMDYVGRGSRAIWVCENTMVNGRRVIPWLIFSGVFERHPQLRLVITEIPGIWWSQWVEDLDSIWSVQNPEDGVRATNDECPLPPSQYLQRNVFVGASFMSRTEAEAASRDGYWGNYMWGSDYPHPEGTFSYPERWDQTPLTQVAWSATLHDLPGEHVSAMLGQNAIRVYGLDEPELRRVAEHISAPTLESVNHALPVPPGPKGLAFRGKGVWGP